MTHKQEEAPLVQRVAACKSWQRTSVKSLGNSYDSKEADRQGTIIFRGVVCKRRGEDKAAEDKENYRRAMNCHVIHGRGS